MAHILTIDTATTACSVALVKDGTVQALRENNQGLNHSVLLAPYIDALLREHRLEVRDLDAIAVSMGPGSYTGLRIGVSTAKGLCFGAGIPLIAVPTLRALARAVANRTGEDALYCPMLDARRMEVYTALFDRHNHPLTPTRAEIITPDSFAKELADRTVYFFGNGSDKARPLLTSPHARFIPGVETSAAHLAPLAEQLFREGEFADTAYFEPFYLKDFIATTPKKKVL